uniref:Hexosyltransferase n=1 Tax=Corethron hystrix TaxID=216773 RepID=A0A7S1FT30_9STRA|mmetsp:Transcript_29537/g.67910  ORF Transcript_29537/g.67910 Transcript_29537/m.67910 type:complete len:157 (+) Transcript_29537:27-497(+)
MTMTKPSRRATALSFLFLVRPPTGVFSLSLSPPIPILYDSSNNLHRSIQYHAEQPARVSVCVDALREHATSRDGDGDVGYRIRDVAPESSSADVELSEDRLTLARSTLADAHSEEYVAGFQTRCLASREARIAEGKNPLGFVGYVDSDTYLTTECE